MTGKENCKKKAFQHNMHVVPILSEWQWHVWVFSFGLKIVHRLSQPVSGPSTSLSDSDLSLCRARVRSLSLSPSPSLSLSTRGSLARQDMAILWRIFANIALFFYLVASMRASKWCACVSFFSVSVFTCAHMSAYVDVCVTYFLYTPAIYIQNSIGRWWIVLDTSMYIYLCILHTSASVYTNTNTHAYMHTYTRTRTHYNTEERWQTAHIRCNFQRHCMSESEARLPPPS